jgi:hypothetical protein
MLMAEAFSVFEVGFNVYLSRVPYTMASLSAADLRLRRNQTIQGNTQETPPRQICLCHDLYSSTYPSDARLIAFVACHEII